MRIALFHNLGAGGAKRHLYEQARVLHARGHRLDPVHSHRGRRNLPPPDRLLRSPLRFWPTLSTPFSGRSAATGREGEQVGSVDQGVRRAKRREIRAPPPPRRNSLDPCVKNAASPRLPEPTPKSPARSTRAATTPPIYTTTDTSWRPKFSGSFAPRQRSSAATTRRAPSSNGPPNPNRATMKPPPRCFVENVWDVFWCLLCYSFTDNEVARFETNTRASGRVLANSFYSRECLAPQSTGGRQCAGLLFRCRFHVLLARRKYPARPNRRFRRLTAAR